MQLPGCVASIVCPAATMALIAHPMKGQLAWDRDSSKINWRPLGCEINRFAQDGASPFLITSLNDPGEYDCFTNRAKK